MPETANATTNAPDSLALSQVERVVDTFIEPSKTFADIKRNRSWWLPFIILVLLGYVFSYSAVQHVGWNALTTNVLRSNPRNGERLEKATPAQEAQMLSVTKGFMEGFMVGGPVVWLVLSAFFALILWGIFSFVLGGNTNYLEMFAVSIYAALPAALGTIVAIATVFASDPQSYNISVPSPATLAYFLDSTASGWFKSLGMSLDLFSLWSLALAGFGGAIVAKVKPARGIAVFAIWIVYVVIKVGIAAATS
jgi:Yip1-like protein